MRKSKNNWQDMIDWNVKNGLILDPTCECNGIEGQLCDDCKSKLNK